MFSTHSPTSVALATPTHFSSSNASSRAVACRLLASRESALQERRVEGPRERRDDRARRDDRVAEDLRERLALGLALEEALAGERLPQHDGRRVDVDGARELASRELLGRHVRELALDLAVARDLDAARGLRDAEVEHARDAVGADEHVLRGDVAMDEVERSPRSFFASCAAWRPWRKPHMIDAAMRGGHVLALLARRAKQLRERLAVDVLHDEEELAVGRDDVDRRDDVRVLDARGEARLVEEHRDELGILGELRMQPLDRDGAREADRAEQAAEVDRRHAAGGDLVVERITPYDAKRSARSAAIIRRKHIAL